MFVRQRFHLSVYVTLGMACACLGYAELTFLPEMSFLAMVVAGLLVVAYRLEGRWSLSLCAANNVGGVIGIGAIAWVAYQFLRPWGGTLLDQLPWPTSLLPYLGPLLMILIPAKLFRPKHEGDIWGLQGIGLIAVALGCALAGDPVFGALLLGYLVCLMWSLTLFYFYRQQQGAGAVRFNSDTRPRWSEPPRALGQSGRWAALVTALALLVFLVTPRAGDARWQLTLAGGRLQTGYADERPGIDLNNSGTLSLNREVAFTVTAYDASGNPKTDLDSTMRWRGATFNHYEGGKWEDRPIPDGGLVGRTGFAPTLPSVTRFAQLPDYRDPRQIVLHIEPSNRMANPTFLAEPVWPSYPANRKEEKTPAVSVYEGRPYSRTRPTQLPWYLTSDYELRPQPPPASFYKHWYKQIILPPNEVGLGPPLNPREFYLDPLRDFASVPSLKPWTQELLRRLAEKKQVPAAAVSADGVQPEHYEVVARALTDHLSASGEYVYTLTLQRQNTDCDPIEDFLYYIRRGHCNRFSTALALMLRSQGIPTRTVLGFRGLDELGSGRYEVRQSYAHSWVEAMIPRRQPGGDSVWHWLTLDPTPATEGESEAEFEIGQWWDETRVALAAMFKHFIVEYDADQQDRTRSSLGHTVWTWLKDAMAWPVAFVTAGPARFVAGAAVLAFVGWRWRRRVVSRQRVRDPAASVLDRLLAVLGRIAGNHTPGVTPHELAVSAAARLRSVPAALGFADLPNTSVGLYYRVRYAGQPLASDEIHALSARLDAFEREMAPVLSVEPQPAIG